MGSALGTSNEDVERGRAGIRLLQAGQPVAL